MATLKLPFCTHCHRRLVSRSHRTLVRGTQSKERDGRAIRDRKVAIMSSLGHEIERYNSIRFSTHKLKMWLREHKGDASAVDDIGRKRADVENDYIAFYKTYTETRSARSGLLEAQAFFGPTIQPLIAKELTAIENAARGETPDQLGKRLDEENEIRSQLLSAMADEIKHEEP